MIWCVGLYASASTWTFNLVREMALASKPSGGVTPHFCASTYDERRLDAPGLHIIKTHEIDDAATVAAFSRRAHKIIITVRDPRDAVASMMAYQNHDFEAAILHVHAALSLCGQLAPDPRAQIFYYELGFPEQPATAASLAAHLGFVLPPDVLTRIFEGLRRPQVEAYIANMASLPGVLQERQTGDLLDPQTHWHTHHAGRTGEAGRWRRALSTAQAARITDTLGALYKFNQ